METTENKGLVYEFGRFVLDPNERTLLSDGKRLHLPAKEFETLLMLVENNGRALSKEEMMSALWQDAFVEEVNLAKQISKLRKILNIDDEQFIETIPKHGYRFVADLRLTQSLDREPIVVEKRLVKRITVSRSDNSSTELLPPANALMLWRNDRSLRSGGMIAIATLFFLAFAALAYFFLTGAGENTGGVPLVKSVAVLPFRSLGGQSVDEDIRLGLTDALTTKLGNLKQTLVRPTNAVRIYEGVEPLAAGRKLGVEAVLDGTVQHVDGQIRVTVQLINVRDGSVLWGGKFDQEFTDIFNVQDAIAEEVARAIEPGLTGEEKSLLTKRYTTNPEAHHAYVRGRYAWNKRTMEDLRDSIRHFNDAIAQDPNYALAYAGLADSYSLLADYRGAPGEQSYERAREAARKALTIDDELAEAHTSLAYVSMYRDWDWEGAETGYRRAIQLNPNYATAHQWYSEYLAAMGRFDEALAAIRRAKEIDPLAPVINAGEVWILYHARRYDEAIEQGEKLQKISPEFAEVHEYLKRCYDQQRMFKDAIAARQMRRKLTGLDPLETPAIKRASSAENHETYWRSRLQQEIADAQQEPPSTFDMAEIYAQLGEKDKAFEWLEKAFEERTYTMMYLKVAPALDPLRGDARFDEMLRRVNLAN